MVLLLNVGLVSAITPQEIDEAKTLIDSKVSCDTLTNEQLELIGEYYMEQMHPGESHELMHKMMGLEEGTEAEEQFHISMAKRLYCNENSGGMMGSGGMMPMMNMMGGGTMMGYGSGAMGSGGFGWGIMGLLWWALLVGLVVLVWLLIMKLWGDMVGRKVKKL